MAPTDSSIPAPSAVPDWGVPGLCSSPRAIGNCSCLQGTMAGCGELPKGRAFPTTVPGSCARDLASLSLDGNRRRATAGLPSSRADLLLAAAAAQRSRLGFTGHAHRCALEGENNPLWVSRKRLKCKFATTTTNTWPRGTPRDCPRSPALPMGTEPAGLARAPHGAASGASLSSSNDTLITKVTVFKRAN